MLFRRQSRIVLPSPGGAADPPYQARLTLIIGSGNRCSLWRTPRRLRMIRAHAQGRNPTVASRFRMSALILFLILPSFLPNFPSHNWIMLKNSG